MSDHHAILEAKDRFFTKFTPLGPDECWEWEGTTRNGYGVLAVRRGEGKNFTNVGAHRVALFFHTGEMPEGLYACHECDNPICVNPRHLTWGTQRYNMQGAKARGRIRFVAPPRLRPEQAARGERNGFAKLTSERVREIYRLRMTGMVARDIGPLVNISWQQVHFVICGKAWAHMLKEGGAPTVEQMRTIRSGMRYKISKADAEMVKTSPKTGKALAAELGVSTALISMIRNGKA